jgi:hypothetical protein
MPLGTLRSTTDKGVKMSELGWSSVNMNTVVPAGTYEARIIKCGQRMETQVQFTEDTTGVEIDRDLTETYGEPVICYAVKAN